MHVGLNLVYLVPGETGGMETYARELIPALAARGDLRLTAFVNRAAARAGGPWAELAEQQLVPVDVGRRTEWVRGEQQHVPRLAHRAGVDLVHSLGSTGPLWGAAPRVTTVHDLHYRLVPDAHFGVRGLGMRVLVPAAVRRSRRVIADAWSTRADLVRLLGTSPDKIDVVPLGVAAPGGIAATPESQLRGRLELGGGQVLLTVSAKRPHKNLASLLRAHASIASQRRPVLVVPGYPTPHERELRELARDLGSAGWVRFPAWVSPEDLEGLYAIALGFVFPSLYEGFGLPVLEAMRRGVPVACSDRSSLPEVAGDAALLFDPTDEVAMASALARLLDDEPLRRRLRLAGPKRAARFTWEATAAATLTTYRRTLG